MRYTCTIIQTSVFCIDKTGFLRPGHIWENYPIKPYKQQLSMWEQYAIKYAEGVVTRLQPSATFPAAIYNPLYAVLYSITLW